MDTIVLLPALPMIKAASLEIAYDNGMINRECSEGSFLRSVEEIIAGRRGNVYSLEDLDSINKALKRLERSQFEDLCAGEQQAQDAALAYAAPHDQPLQERIELLLNDIFERGGCHADEA